MKIILTCLAVGLFITVCVCGVLLAILLINTIINVFNATIGNAGMNKLKFKSFISFYNINPQNWSLWDDHVVYWRSGVQFRFSCSGYVRYVLWKNRLAKQKTAKKNAEEYQRTLEYIKRDLEEFNRKNEQMIKKEAEKIRKIDYDIFGIPFDE